MADGAQPAMEPAVTAAALRHVLLVEAAPDPDALARILARLAVIQARLSAVDYRLAGGTAFARLEIDDLDAAAVERLRARLAAMPMVRAVGLGWLGT